VNAEDLERFRVGAAASGDLRSTARDEVELGEVLVEANRVEHAEHRDGTRERDPRGAGGDGAEHHGW
jgi:hypothetical protein